MDSFTTTNDMETDEMQEIPNGNASKHTNTPTVRIRKLPKPALKHSYSTDEEEEDNENDDRPQRKPKAKKKTTRLQWDEAKIKEHDKLRGTRMKIEEANTPFAYYDSGSETDGSLSSAKKQQHNRPQISWETLSNKLEAHVVVQDRFAATTSPSTSDDEKREKQRRELKRLEFQEHRKKHYNEMEVLRRFRRDHPDGEPSFNGNHSENDENDHDGDDEDEQ